VKFLAVVEMAAAPRVVWASACHARDPTNRTAAVAVKAIANLRIAVLLDLRPSLLATMLIEDTCLFNVGHAERRPAPAALQSGREIWPARPARTCRPAHQMPGHGDLAAEPHRRFGLRRCHHPCDDIERKQPNADVLRLVQDDGVYPT
jgi:hypothetical protein